MQRHTVSGRAVMAAGLAPQATQWGARELCLPENGHLHTPPQASNQAMDYTWERRARRVWRRANKGSARGTSKACAAVDQPCHLTTMAHTQPNRPSAKEHSLQRTWTMNTHASDKQAAQRGINIVQAGAG